MRFFMMLMSVSLLMSWSLAAAEMTVHKRDGYDRIVIEGSGVSVLTEKETALDVKVSNVKNPELVTSQTPSIQKVAAKKDILTLTFSEAVTDKRYFKIGSRLIIDLFYDAKKIKAVEAVADIVQPTPKPTKEVVTAEPVLAEEPEMAFLDVVNNGLANFLDAVLAQEAEEQPSESDEKMQESADPAPDMKLVEEAPPLAQPTILTLSSTRKLGLAVFERYGRLFIVADRENVGLPPQITGAGKELKWELKDVPMTKAKAWSLDMPEGAFVRAEGGGFIWRIIISDQNPELSSAPIKRVLDGEEGPQLRVEIKKVRNILRFRDPDYGDDLAVFATSKSSERSAVFYDFADFDILPAIVGAVVKPQADGVRVSKEDGYIAVEKRDGLNIARRPQDAIVQAYLSPIPFDDEAPRALSNSRIFYFDDWGADVALDGLRDHRQNLDYELVKAEKDEKLDIVFELVRFSLSQAMGQEALGYLSMAPSLNPNVKKMPEYKAMKGASHFLARQYDLANDSFSDENLASNTEVLLWKAAALSEMGRLDAMMNAYPYNADVTRSYPFPIRMQVLAPIIQGMIEKGKGEEALKLVKLIDVEDKVDLTHEDYATIAYLKGRAEKIAGYPDKAAKSLSKASLSDKLGPYGIRSEMMLVNDEVKREVVELPEAIKRMERLRFAWRGDLLENDIYKQLGGLYIDNQQPRQGLNILKRATETAKSVKERRATVRDMSDAYNNLFIGDAFETLDPVEAITVYDEFKELTPVGDEGNQIIDRLADKLMDIGLLSRAVSVLQDKVERLEGGQDAIKTGLRIAAIQLIDRQPEATSETLKQVDSMIALYDGDDKDELNEKIIMLKARAFSDQGQAENALFMMEGLPDTDDVLRLRVDTAWRATNWVAVSDNLDKLILRENLSTDTTPTQAQSQMVLNQAIALSLSGQTDALARFAAQYDDVMKQSPAYKTFQLVTRPSKISTLADRDTLLGLTSEVDLFNGFLENTKAN